MILFGCWEPQKKLEQIKSQRQKDAKELVTMKHMKDRAVIEMTELRRQNKELHEKLGGVEEEMGRIRESVSQTSLKLGTPSIHDSTTSISSRARPSQQPSSAASVKRSPSLSQVLSHRTKLRSLYYCFSSTFSSVGLEISYGETEGGGQ